MGAFIAFVAIVVRHEIVFAVMSAVFIMEAMSVILKVSSFDSEKKESLKWLYPSSFWISGWKSQKIIVRFGS